MTVKWYYGIVFQKKVASLSPTSTVTILKKARKPSLPTIMRAKCEFNCRNNIIVRTRKPGQDPLCHGSSTRQWSGGNLSSRAVRSLTLTRVIWVTDAYHLSVSICVLVQVMRSGIYWTVSFWVSVKLWMG
ncbi:unnamed protein product [Colias eurytheme]|nr:unnamed protein product [Colias eurytheme]